MLCRIFVFAMSGNTTCKVSVALLSETNLAIDAHRFHTLAFSELADIQDFYVAELAADFKSVVQLRSDGPFLPFPPLSSIISPSCFFPQIVVHF